MDHTPAPPPPAVPSPPIAPGPAQPPKKGLHPLIWVAIGCGGLIFLAVVLFMALGFFALRKAKEHVYTRDGKTVFRTDNGEVSVGGEEGSGTLEVTTEKGTMKVQSGAQAKLPDWLPPYPGGTPKGSFTMKIPDGESVMCTWTTSDSPDKVQQFYQKALQDAGLEVATISTGGEAGGILTGRDKSEKRTAQVVVSVERGKTAVQVTCQTKSAKDE
jgi:hypothetical protein